MYKITRIINIRRKSHKFINKPLGLILQELSEKELLRRTQQRKRNDYEAFEFIKKKKT